MRRHGRALRRRYGGKHGHASAPWWLVDVTTSSARPASADTLEDSRHVRVRADTKAEAVWRARMLRGVQRAA